MNWIVGVLFVLTILKFSDIIKLDWVNPFHIFWAIVLIVLAATIVAIRRKK